MSKKEINKKNINQRRKNTRNISRELARNERVMIKKREIRRKAKLRRLLAFLAIVIILTVLLIIIFSRKNRKEIGERSDPASKTDKNPSLEKAKAISPEASLEEKSKDFDKRVAAFIKDKKIDKADLSIAYYNLDKGDALSYNDKAVYRLGKSNDFMLAILLYDMGENKEISLDENVQLLEKNDKKDKKSKKDKTDQEDIKPVDPDKAGKSYTVRGLIKLMVQVGSDEARYSLEKYIEDKTSKYWYDALSDRYRVQLSYKNEMSQKDTMLMLRRLFNQRDLSLEERNYLRSELDNNFNDEKMKDRIREQLEEKIFTYQELINFMAASKTDSSIDQDLINKSLFSENYGVDYGDRTLMGYVLGDRKYLYIISSKNKSKTFVYDGLKMINAFHDYYN